MMVDACAIPQDDYFEWEDLMHNRPFNSYDDDFSFLPDYDTPKDLLSCFKSLEQQVSPQPVSLPVYEDFNIDWSYTEQSNTDTEIIPQASKYTQATLEKQDIEINQTHAKEDCLRLFTDSIPKAHDDLDIAIQPTQNVDYLAFPWHQCESDLWASRKHLETRKKINGHEDQTYDRLRNASWRAVAVGRLKLKKVDPRSFNWLKDQDLTWLHGPFVSQSTRPSLAINNQITQLSKATVKAVKQENRPQKSALKRPTLKTLLLRGSHLPARNPKKRNIDILGQKKRQKQALRFSPEVLQFSCSPASFTNERIPTTPLLTSELPKINTNTFIASSSHQSTKCHPNGPDFHKSGCNSKSEHSSFQPHVKKESTEPILRTVYQVPSGRLRAEQMSEEVAAFSRALREVVDAQHRNISAYQYHAQMPLRPTITA